MNYAAVRVMQEFTDIILAYGQSDEYSFVFNRNTTLYNRRASKILSTVNSLFTSSYVFFWSHFISEKLLLYPPTFDARIILYPTDKNLRDYLSWRQADTHINNLYNTVFWKLVLDDGKTNSEAESELCGTFSSDKNEILFSKFGVNYNNLSEMYRKGSILIRKNVRVKHMNDKKCQLIIPLFTDLIQDRFWNDNPEILTDIKSGEYELRDDLIQNSLIKKQLERYNNR